MNDKDLERDEPKILSARERRIEERRQQLRRDPDAIAWGGLRFEAQLEIERGDAAA